MLSIPQLVRLLTLVTLLFLPLTASAASPCGGDGQRACCFLEANFGACHGGLTEIPGCSGDCVCSGGLASSSGTCTSITACGGVGERACCVGEAGFGACQGGLSEIAGCSGNCYCGGGILGSSSSGTCVQISACGGSGQRACCLGEAGAACGGGLVEVPGCSGDCLCSGGLANSSGMCVPVTSCGGNGQRACCVGESGSACGSGLAEVPGCGGNCYCGGGVGGSSSSSSCVAVSACGGNGQRGCCIGEAGAACGAGLAQVNGCSGDCRCPGSLGTYSSGTCTQTTACGGPGERACCVGEGNGACGAGLTEVPGCSGNCLCDSDLGTSSSGTCVLTSACGGEGQRACCVGEGAGACAAGLVESAGCTGNCYCAGGVLGTESSSSCIAPSACGGEGERACCVLETSNGGNGGGCDDGLMEVPGCTGNCLCTDGVLGSQSSGTCQAVTEATDCGGPGQRACCGITFEGANCDEGLIEVAGCAGNCLCGGVNPLGVFASGTCHPPTACGGNGQRACCTAERLPSCNDGLIEIPGCSGDCFCGGSLTGIVDDDVLGTSSGTCIENPAGAMAEPSIGFSDTAGEQACTQLGYADMHMHLFGDIAHGGAVIGGQPCPRSDAVFCPEAFAGKLTPGTPGPGQTHCGSEFCDASRDVNDALHACYGTDYDMRSKSGDAVATPNCPSWLGDCGDTLFHGDHTAFEDPVGAFGTLDGSASNMGAPAFNAWPQWTTTTHQQNYYKWLERAWRGGLRLIVQLAVNNTALCKTYKHLAGVDCDNSMAFIDQQLQAAYDFEHFIDLEAGNGTDVDSGWFRIVKTPSEARGVLAKGKLAVVLGIEVDHPFNCGFPSEQCELQNDNIVSCNMTSNTSACRDPSDSGKSSADWVREQVDYYYDVWGVRHMFPVHNFDNAFGGAATWQSPIEVGNRWVEGHWYKTRDCSAEGYNFKLGQEGTFMQSLMSALGFGELTTVPIHPEAASCNAFGLFPLGNVLIQHMMERGMLIDIDHMSALSLQDTITLAQQFRPSGYPLAASHALFMDLNAPAVRHERLRTAEQLAQIKAMGGMLAVMLKDDALDSDRRGQRTTIDYEPAGVVDDCRHSSKTFLQALAYAQDKVGVSALGSDFDGAAGHFAPRFGSDACGGDPTERSAQMRSGQALEYPFELANFGTFDRQVSGLKSFDYNVDGLAHVGLLPDFVADLTAVGGREEYLEPLMRSADAYLRMWELANGEQPATCDCNDADDDGVEDCRDRCPGVDDPAGSDACPVGADTDDSAASTNDDPSGSGQIPGGTPTSTAGLDSNGAPTHSNETAGEVDTDGQPHNGSDAPDGTNPGTTTGRDGGETTDNDVATDSHGGPNGNDTDRGGALGRDGSALRADGGGADASAMNEWQRPGSDCSCRLGRDSEPSQFAWLLLGLATWLGRRASAKVSRK